MISNQQFVELFFSKSIETTINEQILADKLYVVPKDVIMNYVFNAIKIPYIEFLQFSARERKDITIDQFTQCSSFTACSTEMCSSLLWHGNPGYRFIDIGKLFPQYVRSYTPYALQKYGENQVKTASQLGLTFEYYGYWYLNCIGYIFNDLNKDEKISLLARLLLRVPLYGRIINNLIEKNVDLCDYMYQLSPSTQGRRAPSILKMVEICVEECKKNNLKCHILWFPKYSTRNKKLSKYRKDFSYSPIPYYLQNSDEIDLNWVIEFEKGISKILFKLLLQLEKDGLIPNLEKYIVKIDNSSYRSIIINNVCRFDNILFNSNSVCIREQNKNKKKWFSRGFPLCNESLYLTNRIKFYGNHYSAYCNLESFINFFYPNNKRFKLTYNEEIGMFELKEKQE